jgi:hypothetical protein
MDHEWLNRLGIVLNFLAGFLLAPELIGLHRLSRFEEWLETQIKLQLESIKHLYAPIEKYLYIGFPMAQLGIWLEVSARKIIILVLVLSLFSILWWAVFVYILASVKLRPEYTATVVFFFITVPSSALWVISSFNLNTEVLKTIFFFVTVIAVLQWGFVGGIFVVGMYLLPKALEQLLTLSLHSLMENEGLRSIVVTVGVVFFIIGNFLQLWATFGPDKVRPLP